MSNVEKTSLEKALTIDEAAKELGYSPLYLRQLVHNKKIISRRIGNWIRIYKSDNEQLWHERQLLNA